MKNLLVLITLLSILACHRTNNTDASTTKTVAEAVKPVQEVPAAMAVEPVEESAKEKVARMQSSHQKLKAPSPLGQMPIELAALNLQQLCQNKYGCLKETIYPIGWSKDGKFAYCIEYPNEAADMYRMDFFVLDTKTNTKIDQASFKAESTSTFQGIWTNKKDDFVEDMQKHGIEIGNSFDIKSFPIIRDDSPISCSVDKQIVKSDYTGDNIIMESKVVVKGEKREGKQICKETYGKYDLILDTEVVGYLESPFEDHILVIYAKEKRGFEGPPNVLGLSFIGYSLGE